MKTMSLLLCHNGHHFAPSPIEGCAFNHPIVISCLIWAIVVIILGILVYCYLKNRNQIKKDMADALQSHELAIKEKLFVQEKYWHDENRKAKDDELTRKIREYNELTKVINNEDLERKIREYNELTIHQKIMDKVTGIDKEMNDFKNALEELKKKYESLDGEIEHIIIKKKQ